MADTHTGVVRGISENGLILGLRRLWRTIWVTRVAAISVFVGFALLWNVTQVHDLFAEIKGDPAIAIPFWIAFYALVIFVWAVPVYLSSKLSIDYYRECIDPAAFGNSWPRIYPTVLVSLIFLAIIFSVLFALSNLHLTSMAGQTDNQLSIYFRELKTLLGDVMEPGFGTRTLRIDQLSMRHLLILPLITLLIGLITIYLVSRIDTKWETNIFTAIFVFIISVLAVAMVALDPLHTAELFPRILLFPIMLGAWVPLLSFVAHWSHRVRIPLLLCIAAVPAVYGLVAGDNHDVNGVAVTKKVERPDLDTVLCKWAKANFCSIRQIKCNLPAATQCPSPIIIAAAGGASRAAFYTGTVLGHLLDQTLNGANASRYRDFHNQVLAISGVSGGALGAAIFSASVRHSRTKGAANSAQPAGNVVATKDIAGPPCRAEADRQLWFGAITLPSAFTPKISESWQSCLQLILSGDFLTASMASLTFHDLLGFPWRGDRATTLERAWEKSVADATGSDFLTEPFFTNGDGGKPGQWQPLMIFNGSSVETGRRIVVSRLNPNLCGASGTGSNGSLSLCTRIFKDSYDFYELLSDRQPAKGFWSKRIVTNPCKCPAGQQFCSCDVKLSTAISTSARFPIISPHGNIRNSRGQIIDRVVDGSYFEGFGALSALEFAEAVGRRGLRPFVLLISNSPDLPDLPCLTDRDPKTACQVPSIRARQASLVTGPCPPDADDLQWSSSVRATFGGLFNTRIARGTHASVRLCTWARQQNERRFEFARRYGWTTPRARDNFALLRVWPQDNSFGDMKTLSMSWWLSKPIQSYLNAQISSEKNKAALNKVLCVLSKDIAASPNCQAAASSVSQ
ncbi:hypothetical protein MnTg02_00837 [bacterium MnTg02]|nr:hypothetical protein MnTg02_00837 [bacterium MnTg02]